MDLASTEVKGRHLMANRPILSYVLFILGVLVLVLFGLLGGEWLLGIALGLIFAVVGAILYRRGK
jgi:hypothetical protein